MKNGDMVRFRDPSPVNYAKMTDGQLYVDNRPWMIGLLVEYRTWEKIANILYEGRIVRIPAREVQLHTRGDNV